MERRTFLRLLAAGAAASALPPFLFSSETELPTLHVRLDGSHPLGTLPADFTGLSYESLELFNPNFFSPANQALVGFFRRLGRQGVLRLGGNTSEYMAWMPDGKTPHRTTGRFDPADKLYLREHSEIPPESLRNLRGFLEATGWSCIFGLNLGTGTPEEAAEFAKAAATALGPKLKALQIGNEPDILHEYGLRPKPEQWGFKEFAAEWQQYFDAIRKEVPEAPFAGPDSCVFGRWVQEFAEKFHGQTVLLSSHHYNEGPPPDPTVTLERLLKPNEGLLKDLKTMGEVSRSSGLPFRMTEGNSCYRGGKHGVSDTAGAALWGLDFMLLLASHGVAGVNLHCVGGTSTRDISDIDFHQGGYGWYSAIAGNTENGFLARPLYYGMLLFEQMGGGQLIESAFDLEQAHLPVGSVTAYGLRAPQGRHRAVLVNKSDTQNLRVELEAGERANQATLLRLSAPRLDDNTDLTLGAAPVGADGTWQAEHQPVIVAKEGRVEFLLPKASAVLVTFR
jgi:hypothetical protein